MADWEKLQAQINDILREWRRENPTASLMEIENAVDANLAEVKKQIVEDLIHESGTADIIGLPEAKRPTCPKCDKPMVANGKKKRRLKTSHEKEIEIDRHQAYCPDCKVTFFPSG